MNVSKGTHCEYGCSLSFEKFHQAKHSISGALSCKHDLLQWRLLFHVMHDESCTSIMQSFVYHNIHQKAGLCFEHDHSGTCMLLLQQMIAYLHNMYVTHQAGEYANIIVCDHVV